MKRLFALIALTLCCHAAFSQRHVLMNSSFRISATVKDSLSGEAVAFASVYLQPAKDTIITHFTLSDSEGKAFLDRVTPGNYRLNVEMLGYKPYRKIIYFSTWKDIGTLLMQPDMEALKAAVITEKVNPLEVRQDTLIYNAAAYRIGENDVLKDLLRQMPGIELGEDGSVKVQGETVRRITVNGRTFFTGDNSAALDNIPSKAVEKVTVTDADADRSAVTGIKRIGGGSSGKKMDVSLKQEYSKGLFGRVSAAAGSSIPSKGQDELVATPPFLWNVNGMLAAFGKQDQVTAVARGENVSDSDRLFVRDGLSTEGQTGVNFTTDRIQGYDTDLSVYYNANSRKTGSHTESRSFPGSEDEYYGDSFQNGRSTGQNLRFNASISNMRNSRRPRPKHVITAREALQFSRTGSSSSQSSETRTEDALRSRATSENSSLSKRLSNDGSLTYIQLSMGKAGRSLSVESSYSLSFNKGDSRDYSLTEFLQTERTTSRDILYKNGGGSGNGSVTITYVEPFSESWKLQSSISGDVSSSGNQKKAFNPDGSGNDHYSSDSRTNGYSGNTRVLAQYSSGKVDVQFGASLHADYTKTVSHDGISGTSESGGDVIWKAAPFLNFGWGLFSFGYSGSSTQPSHSSMMPSLDISNPTSIGVGNVYLKPSFSHRLHMDLHLSQRRTQRSDAERYEGRGTSVNGMVRMDASFDQGPTVSASWFDEGGIRYRIPVIAKHPGITLSPSATLNIPVGKSPWSFDVNFRGNYSVSVNYQAKGKLPGIDTPSFDYKTFMGAFWGDESGSRFYSGESGFEESLTRNLSIRPSFTVRFNNQTWRASAGTSARGTHAWFTLDGKADSHTWVASAFLDVQYTTRNDYTFRMDYNYDRYIGFADVFKKNMHNLNVRISKDIKAFSLYLSGKDLLNRGVSVSHRVGSDNVSDTFTLSMGRYILAGVSYRFGKMNARNSRKAADVEMFMDGSSRMDGGFRSGEGRSRFRR